jgi:predicted nucleic acid-binding protein
LPFVLDTNVLIRLRDGDKDITERVQALPEPLLMSIVSRVELENGVYIDPGQSHIRRTRLDAILASVPALPFDDAAAEIYRKIVEAAGYSRRKLLDRMIAAQAILHRAKLVTLNPGGFSDIPDLDLVGW